MNNVVRKFTCMRVPHLIRRRSTVSLAVAIMLVLLIGIGTVIGFLRTRQTVDTPSAAGGRSATPASDQQQYINPRFSYSMALPSKWRVDTNADGSRARVFSIYDKAV